MRVICLHCDGSGCPRCKYDRLSAAGGDQGPSATEVELEHTRAELAKTKSLLDISRGLLAEARRERDEAEREAAYAQDARDVALAQLALLSKRGAA